MSQIAIVSARGLGDSLLTMVVANNLHHSGHKVHFFSDAISSLNDFFPVIPISSFPNNRQFEEIIQNYDKVCLADGVLPDFLKQHRHNENIFVLDRKHQSRNCNYAQSFIGQLQGFCKFDFITIENGLQIPQGFAYRKYKKRVCIHPTSNYVRKNWPKKKFITIAKRLQRDGFEPYFVLTKREIDSWNCLINNNFEYVCLPLDRLAGFVYESGYMIANDSGPGHLASNLKIPLLSIFPKKSKITMWGALWGERKFVTPLIRLPGKRGSHYWQHFLTVKKVEKIFHHLCQAID